MKLFLQSLIAALCLFALRMDAAHGAAPGQDYLACDKYKKEIVKYHDKGQGIGCFAKVDGFGNGISAIDYILRRRKDIPFIRIQLAWSDRHEYDARLMNEAAGRAKHACGLTKKYPDRLWFFSGATESALSGDKARLLRLKILNACPQARYVNNPMPQGATLKNTLNEFHGGSKPREYPCGYSFDGHGAEDADVDAIRTKFANCDYYMLWTSAYNLRTTVKDNTPRARRRYLPSADLIKSINYLANERGDVYLPKNWLLKTHSEKGHMPVFIIPIKTSFVSLQKENKEIGKCPYYGSYVDGRSRYYCNDWGYKISEKARKMSGIPTVNVIVNHKKYGEVNMAFRTGDFR